MTITIEKAYFRARITEAFSEYLHLQNYSIIIS